MNAQDYLEHHGILGMKWGVRRRTRKDILKAQKRYNRKTKGKDSGLSVAIADKKRQKASIEILSERKDTFKQLKSYKKARKDFNKTNKKLNKKDLKYQKEYMKKNNNDESKRHEAEQYAANKIKDSKLYTKNQKKEQKMNKTLNAYSKKLIENTPLNSIGGTKKKETVDFVSSMSDKTINNILKS